MTNFKALAFAALAAVATTGAASANEVYSSGLDLDNSYATISTVVANGSGVVSVYDFQNGTKGALLGSANVHAGQNNNVRVPVNGNGFNDVIAVLEINGAATSSEVIAR